MRNESGFTLIELLAAMVAGSILLVSLGWSVATLGRELAKAEARDAAERPAAAAGAYLALAEQAIPPGAKAGGFAGAPDRLEAIVPPPMAATAAGPLRLTLRVDGAEGAKRLSARLEPVDPGAPFPATLRAERVLASGHRDIRFDYVTEAKAPGKPDRLPRLIELTLIDGAGVRQTVSAAPRVDSDGRCRFDPISMACRL